MKKNILFCIVLFVFAALRVVAQDGYNERVRKYIDQYYPLAIAEQRNSGIPASITLGQGILETEAGASELMTIANNHFGIKCNNGWLGPTFTHTDDAPDECFKKYSCAAESYKDHSTHLKKNPRYAPLFKCSTTDYASWAVCLKKCGYATNPQYAKQLIKIIEDFKLQEYTYSALDSTNSGYYPAIPASARKKEEAPLVVKENKEEATAAVTENDQGDNDDANDGNSFDTSNVIRINGMKAFYANKGETLLKYADQYHIKYARLLEMNDLQDAPLPFSMYVYLEKKLTYGTHPQHTVLYGETIYMISQTEGMQFKKLLALNMLTPNDEPVTGAVLELQTAATRKPMVRTNQIKAHKGNAIVMSSGSDAASADDYIAIDRTKAAAQPTAKVATPAPANDYVATNKPKPTVAASPANGDDYAATSKPKNNTPAPSKPAGGDDYIAINKPKPTAPVAAKPSATSHTDGYEANWDETTPAPAKPAIAKGKPAPAKPAAASGYETNWDDDAIPAKPVAKAKSQPAATTPVKGDGFVTNRDDDAPAKPATAKAKPQPVAPAHADGYVTNWDETTPAPAKKPVAAVKHDPVPPVAAKKEAADKDNTKNRGANPDAGDDDDDDLASLKANMDKVVYADDSKLPVEKPKTAAPTKKEPVVEKTKTAQKSTAKYYTIKRGDTAFSIAKRNNISVEDLLKMNDIDASDIKTGYKIQVSE